MNKNNIAKIITSILLLLLLIGAFGLIFQFTNGFKEDFKTFYLTHDGKDIVTTNSKMYFPRGEEYRFDVKYVFEFLEDDEANADYNVKIVPNVDEKTDFTFTVDGKEMKYSSVSDLTSGFDLDKQDGHFTLTVPKNASIGSVLKSVYGESVKAPSDEDCPSLYLYTLVVK